MSAGRDPEQSVNASCADDSTRLRIFASWRRRLFDNWAQSWSLGRFEFEVEWVPRGRYYMFTFSIKTPEKWGKERGLL